MRRSQVEVVEAAERTIAGLREVVDAAMRQNALVSALVEKWETAARDARAWLSRGEGGFSDVGRAEAFDQCVADLRAALAGRI